MAVAPQARFRGEIVIDRFAMPGEDIIDDIEDLIAAGDLKPSDRYNNKKDVTFRGKREKKSENGSAQENGELGSVNIYLTFIKVNPL